MARKTSKNKQEGTGQQELGRVILNPLVSEIQRSYLDYAMSVIIGRALPDARDGLKPVQRRVLYGMMGLGIRHNQPYKKSARVVGEVMGKYHPHGDASIYDTMVRLAQPWNLRYPLVDGQGNFGSLDGDSAAAMRYTEARFAELGELMLRDIDEDTVKWGPNFDESLQEPLTLPSVVPNLLINGSTGIAVGMATNMPPHNLREVVSALCCLIDHPDAGLKELMKHLPGPDFPTGGIIVGTKGIEDAYTTGRGRIVVRGRCTTETENKKTSVVITEIPYMVNKTALIEDIAKCIQDHTISGVSDLRDESDREGLRIVLDLSRDGSPELVQRRLYEKTNLQSTFGIINLTLVDNRPVELGLKQLLEVFLTYRRDVVRKRTAFRLKKAKDREHIVEGLMRALDMIDEVILLIRGAKDTDNAKNSLVEELAFSEAQAQAILDMRLQRLTGLERDKLMEEMTQLLTDIASYEEILDNPKELDRVIRGELVELRRKFGDKRRTEIHEEEGNTKEEYERHISEDDITVTLTESGTLTRTPLDEKGTAARQAKGKEDEDRVIAALATTTHTDVTLFTSKGRIFTVRGHEIPDKKAVKSRKAEPPVPLSPGEKIVSLPGAIPENADCILIITRKGIAKRLELSEISDLKAGGRSLLSLSEGDSALGMFFTNSETELFMMSRDGVRIQAKVGELRYMKCAARGINALKLQGEDEVISYSLLKGD